MSDISKRSLSYQKNCDILNNEKHPMRNNKKNVLFSIFQKWWFWVLIVIAIGAIIGANDSNIPDGTAVPDDTSPAATTNQVPIVSPESDKYAIVDKFITLYNAASDNPIVHLEEMDISNNDYRPEFRLKAFENAVGKTGVFDNGSISIVNYGVWSNSSIRLYISLQSLDDTSLNTITSIIHILDATISKEDIFAELNSIGAIYLGSGGIVSGYIDDIYTDGSFVGYDIMLDCSYLSFVE